MTQQQWRCPTCGAINAVTAQRCRICRLVVPGAPGAPGAPGLSPLPPPPPPPPPGAWQPPSSAPTYPPPPPRSPTGYPPPPPGWYPGAPLPSKRPRRTGLIVIAVVVPVLIVVGLGIVFLRGTDPAAAKDRDAAEGALLTNADLGGTFSEVAHRAFARSRGGIRIEDDSAECGAADSAFEDKGQALVDTVLQSANALTGGQVVIEEVLVVDSPGSATPVVDSIVDTAQSCVSAAVRDNASTAGLAVSLSPTAAPTVGSRAAAFRGSIGGGLTVVQLDIVVAQQGRAIVLVMTFDATGSLSSRIGDLVDATLLRLAPRFGT